MGSESATVTVDFSEKGCFIGTVKVYSQIFLFALGSLHNVEAQGIAALWASQWLNDTVAKRRLVGGIECENGNG